MPELKPFTPETLVATRRISGYDLAPDGASFVVAVDELSDDGKTYRTNLLRLQAGSQDAGTWLTRDERKKGSPRFLRSGDLAYLSQPDPAALRPEQLPKPEADANKEDPKDAPRQVFVLGARGGAAAQVTDLPCGAESFAWSEDGSRLVMLAAAHAEADSPEKNRELEKAWKDRKPSGMVFDSFPLRFWDHWLAPRHAHLLAAGGDGRDARDLTPGLGFGLFEAVAEPSPDGRLACIDFSTIDADKRDVKHLQVVDLATGARRELTSGQRQHGAPRWSPDGRRIASLTWVPRPRVTGKTDIAIIGAASGEQRLLTDHLDLNPERPVWVDDRTLAFTCDEQGAHVIRLIDVNGGESSVLVGSGYNQDLRVSADRKWIWFVHDRVDAPPELFRVAVSGGAPERMTSLNAGLASTVALSKATSHVVRGAEGADVQLFEVLPPGFDASRKHPMLLWIHGGPIHAYADQYHFRWNAQIYAAKGYVVVMVNPRGSTGFGQDFIEGNNGNWGDLCYRDLMAVADEWMKKPYVDAERVAACGASFGGYMVNWIAGHETRFKCLVSHAGLFHLPSFHGTTDAGPWWELEFGGKPWESPEIYEKWSPHRFASSFKTPTLVIHGELDYRVPLGEGLQMYLALQRQDVPSRLLYFPDENHWILKPANLLMWNETVLAWLGRWLG